MNDIKLYASKKNHILSLLTITENFSNDIGMSFGIDKCKTQSMGHMHKPLANAFTCISER
jgi:hypothetical protein